MTQHKGTLEKWNMYWYCICVIELYVYVTSTCYFDIILKLKKKIVNFITY